MTIRLISFDLDDTLWPVVPVIQNAEKELKQWMQENHPEVAPHYNLDMLRKISESLLANKPEYISNLTALRKEAIKQIFISQGHNHNEAGTHSETGFGVFYEARNRVSFFPGVLQALEQLSKDYTLAALSNGNANLKKIGIDHLIPIHHSAESTGKKKPDPKMFLAALKDAGVAAEHAMHVGDHPVEDIGVARNLGMKTVWANMIDGEWPEEITTADFEITSLQGLLKIINGL